MQYSGNKNFEKEKTGGFSLLELLLALIVGGFLMIAAFKLFDDWGKYTINRKAAKQIMAVHEAAEAYVRANFMEIWSGEFGENTEDVNGDGEYSNSDLVAIGHHFQIPMENSGWTPLFLKDSTGVLPSSFPNVNVFGHQFSAYVRNAGIVGGKKTLEVYTKTWGLGGDSNAVPVPDRHLRDIAASMGAKGGYISAINEENGTVIANVCSSLNSRITGTFGTWGIDVSNLQSPIAGPRFCHSIAPQAGLGGYPVAFGRIYFDDLDERLLYRVEIPGRPELNQMRANLDMDGNSLYGVGTITADYLRVGLIFYQHARSLNSDGFGLYVEEIAQIYGDNESLLLEMIRTVDSANYRYDPDGNYLGTKCAFDGTLVVDVANKNSIWVDAVGSPGCKVMPGHGDLIVKGVGLPAGTPALTVESLLAPEASLVAGTIKAENFMPISGDVHISGKTTVNTATATGISSGSTAVTGSGTMNEFTINSLNSPILEITAGSISASSLSVSGSLNAANIAADKIAVGGSATLEGIADFDDLSAGAITACTAIIQSDGMGGFITVPDYDCTP